MEHQADTLSQIKTPLIFFALSLLVIEGILGAIAGFSGMGSVYRFWLVIVMALLFVIVIGAVIYLTVKYPPHLYNQVSAEIEKDDGDES